VKFTRTGNSVTFGKKTITETFLTLFTKSFAVGLQQNFFN